MRAMDDFGETRRKLEEADSRIEAATVRIAQLEWGLAHGRSSPRRRDLIQSMLQVRDDMKAYRALIIDRLHWLAGERKDSETPMPDWLPADPRDAPRAPPLAPKDAQPAQRPATPADQNRRRN